MSLFGYFIHCFKKYATFKGRARRSEFWGFALFCAIISIPLIVVDYMAGLEPQSFGSNAAWQLATTLPLLAVSWRRLHDLGKSGLWMVLFLLTSVAFAICNGWMQAVEDTGATPSGGLSFVTYALLATFCVFSLVYLIWMASEGESCPNKYGPDPKRPRPASNGQADLERTVTALERIMSRRAVFLDRDETLIEDPGYIADPSLVKLLPGVGDALRQLAEAGFALVVVTNQSGIARGLLTEATLEKIHDELRRQIAGYGVTLDAIYFCPFHPEGTVEPYRKDSDLRKPQPGMILQAAREMNLSLETSWTIGDSPRDTTAGHLAGTRTILVTTNENNAEKTADFIVPDFPSAVDIVLRESNM